MEGLCDIKKQTYQQAASVFPELGQIGKACFSLQDKAAAQKDGLR